eukprot:scaffold5775_cov106-Isochrysis_galbana.AAC.2
MPARRERTASRASRLAANWAVMAAACAGAHEHEGSGGGRRRSHAYCAHAPCCRIEGCTGTYYKRGLISSGDRRSVPAEGERSTVCSSIGAGCSLVVWCFVTSLDRGSGVHTAFVPRCELVTTLPAMMAHAAMSSTSSGPSGAPQFQSPCQISAYPARGRDALLASSQAISGLHADRLRAEPSQLLRYPQLLHYGYFLAWLGCNLSSEDLLRLGARPPDQAQAEGGGKLDEGQAPPPASAPACCASSAASRVSRAADVLGAGPALSGAAMGRVRHCAAGHRHAADGSGGMADPGANLPLSNEGRGRVAEQPPAQPTPRSRRCDICDSATAKPGVCHHCWFDKWDTVVQLRNLEMKAVARREPEPAVRPAAAEAQAEDAATAAQPAAQPPAVLPCVAAFREEGEPRDAGSKRRGRSGVGRESGGARRAKHSRRARRTASPAAA